MQTELSVIPSTAVTERLAEWSNAARGAFAPNTTRAYRTDSATFSAWCAEVGLAVLPAKPSTVAQFLRSQSNSGKSVATVRRRAATIARLHRAAGLSNPCDAEEVRLAVRAIANLQGTQQRQAPALSDRDAHKIADRVGDSSKLKDIRDVALMLVGRDLMARASELVALTAEAVVFDIEGVGAVVELRRHKTSTEAVPYQIGPDAAVALRRWLDAAAIASGVVFRSITKADRVSEQSLTVRDIGRILKALALRARLEPARAAALSGHSLRVGMACDLVAAGIGDAAIMQAAGWTSTRMLARYSARINAKRGAIAQYYYKRN